MANTNLAAARAAKHDEFYTQYHDIEAEMNAYLDYDADAFRGKTVLLPCDDPEWSEFTRYFVARFRDLGLRRLISTSYAPGSKRYGGPWQPTLFETRSPRFRPERSRLQGKIFTLDRDANEDGRIGMDALQWDYLEGDGDFRSAEVRALRDAADIIVTNPPFSLFRAFVDWLFEARGQFLIIGSMNAITYRNIFPRIARNEMWLGNGFQAGNAYFAVPSGENYAESVFDAETGFVKFRNCHWYTNLEHGRRHQPLELMTTADNLRFSRHREIREREAYPRYDNYDAIEVPYVDAIPSDYDGVMGVPITFLDKYCPEQFEILGASESEGSGFSNGLWRAESGVAQPMVNARRVYKRLFIRKRG